MVILTRNKEILRWTRRGRWVLVYGRRKTGKSFFVRNFSSWDKYYFIGRSGEIFEGDEKLSYDAFVREVFENLRNKKTVVIDEIQRLPEEFHDLLHREGVVGNLIAISSTLWRAKKLIGKGSPLLGLFSEFDMPLVSETDILTGLKKHITDGRRLIEHAIYLREPWLIPFFEKAKDFLLAMAADTKITIPALIGEIFSEEDRTLSSVYEGILRAISDGKRVSSEITNYLFSHRLISAQDPSLAHPYLNVLHELGLLEKVKVFGKNKYYYYHRSPVIDLYCYMAEKYGFAERDLPDGQIKKILNEKLPMHAEQFFANLLAGMNGLNKEIIAEKDYEIDIALTDFKKVKLVGEVKWKKAVSEEEIKRAEEVLGRFECKRVLIVPDRSCLKREPKGVEVWDVGSILDLISQRQA